MTETPDIRVLPISDGARQGYTLIHTDTVTTSCVAVWQGDDGKVSAARCELPPGHVPDIDLLCDHAVQPTDIVPWAFAMMGSGNTTALMDVLRIPHVGRETSGEKIRCLLDEYADKHLGGIDREAIKAVETVPSKSLGVLSFYSGEGERAVRRKQAARSYPLLAGLLASNLSAKMAIDRSKPLAETVMSVLGGYVDGAISKAVLKRVAQAGPIPEGSSLDTVVKFMSVVPADWIPSGGQEWEAFCHVAHAIIDDLGAPEKDIPSLVKGCGGKWTDYCSRLVKRSGLDETDIFHATHQTMINASEMIDTFSDIFVLPLAAHAGSSDTVMATPEMLHASRKTAFAMLASGRSGPDIAEMQRRFHQERNAILSGTELVEQERMARIRGEIEDGAWPGLSNPVQAPNGLWLVPLTNPLELEWEGRGSPDPTGAAGLQHCVGGYSTRAKSCDCHILSVRKIAPDGSYERLSTVEFRSIQSGSNVLRMQQNQGQGNSKPPAEAKDAVSWYMAAVAKGGVSLNREQIAAFLDKEHVPDDGVERICGYDWRDRDTLNVAAKPWGQFVVKEFRKGLDELMDAKDVADITAMISPDILMSASR